MIRRRLLKTTLKPSVIHVITRMDMGGSAQNTLLSCLGLSDRFTITLSFGPTFESNMTNNEQGRVDASFFMAKRAGVRLLSIPHLIRKIDPIRDFLSLIELYRKIRQEKPGIVHTHSSKAGLLGRLAAWTAGVPIIVHTPHGHVFYGHFSAIASKVFLWIEKLADMATNHLIALTEGERQDYIRFGVAHPDKISVIHSGVDVSRFCSSDESAPGKKAALGLDPGSLVVGTVGWLLPIKGPLVLLEAMSNILQSSSDVFLYYVGKGDLEESIREKAKKCGVAEQVKLLGWREDVDELMGVFDIFVLPSLNEGMGRVVVEAMAAGKPVVASRTGGILDLVKDGESGFLVPPGDSDALRDAIRCLIGDEGLRKRMGERGRQIAPEYSVEKMVEKIGALYEKLLNDLPDSAEICSHKCK